MKRRRLQRLSITMQDFLQGGLITSIWVILKKGRPWPSDNDLRNIKISDQ